jgi:hypothetical protein
MNNKDIESIACLGMFSSLKLKPEYSEVAKQMLARLKESSKESEGVVLTTEERCQTNGSIRRKCCYYPHEVLGFLTKVGFSANTTIYLTETRWHKDLNALKEAFPNTYTKASNLLCGLINVNYLMFSPKQISECHIVKYNPLLAYCFDL